MAQLNKMLIELRKINGSKSQDSDIQLCAFSNEHVCRQAILGNKVFIIELLRRAEFAEVEGDYLIANSLYKRFTQGML